MLPSVLGQETLPEDEEAREMPASEPPLFRQVLLIEDDPALCQVFTLNLERWGVAVRVAHSTEEALVLLSEWHPDLLLLDVSLPGRTGWDLLRALRSSAQAIPTVIISAVPPSQRRIEEFRPLAYLPKPFPLEALLRLITGLPESRPEEDASASARVGGEEPAGE